ncbi:hypothetical protein C1J03_17580 [Sulfitobacter sp. SK012]|uniref:hypothetical protein n=1 Tax=Sulfitobacter sp. SK012 TaxID=1389005 RepID=UPI000E0A354B|nr:hypothetical protein [Sulfitobacter sp. SK012]AXI47657.1 hypothetical protein C1J03_17580 [Sulfitobacter sp. SK012]
MSGCELLYLPAIPIVRAQAAAEITQPVAVVSNSGKVLASPPQTSVPAKSRFTTTGRAVRCSGTSSRSDHIPVSCSNGMIGEVTMVNDIFIQPYISFLLSVDDEQSEKIFCRGSYRRDGETQGPFLVSCFHEWDIKARRHPSGNMEQRGKGTEMEAAVTTRKEASGDLSVTVWV